MHESFAFRSAFEGTENAADFERQISLSLETIV